MKETLISGITPTARATYATVRTIHDRLVFHLICPQMKAPDATSRGPTMAAPTSASSGSFMARKAITTRVSAP